MVAAAARQPVEGIVPFDPLLHLRPVTELMAQAFAGELGPGARQVLRRMQQMARWGVLGLLMGEFDGGPLGPSGLVWLEGGQVVGNVSLRRASTPGGWIIGNVAVRPDRQGRGIGRALMEAAVQAAREQGGEWVGLEVRTDNDAARGLYERMGFEPVGTASELGRPAGLPWPPAASTPAAWRRARASESDSLYRLAQEGLTRHHREVLELRPSLYRAGWEERVANWFEGCRDDWWVASEAGRIAGALRVNSRWAGRYHQLDLLVLRERMDDLGPQLVAAALAILSRRRPWETAVFLPGVRQSLEPAFVAAGFRPLRHLTQMRLLLGRPIRTVQ